MCGASGWVGRWVGDASWHVKSRGGVGRATASLTLATMAVSVSVVVTLTCLSFLLFSWLSSNSKSQELLLVN